MRPSAKPAKAKVEAELPVARKSRKNEGSRVHDLEKRLAEAQEQQTATAEILRVMSQSLSDLPSILTSVAESACRLCGAYDAIVHQLDGDVLRIVAHHGPIPVSRLTIPATRGTVGGRAVLDRQTVQVTDAQVETEEFPETSTLALERGFHTILSVPLLREGIALGAINLRRTAIQPFTDKQIALLQTFADQAVIAIENVRLFTELEARNRDLTESLDQQTATAEVLKVISRSTFDLRPVLEILIENATRLCGADRGQVYKAEGDVLEYAIAYGVEQGAKDYLQQRPLTIGPSSMAGRAALERRIIHSPDVLAEPWFHPPDDRQKILDLRTVLAVPMLRGEALLGVFTIWKTKVEPFTDRQIELVKTFADQAVIAIENVRLIQELHARTRELALSVEELKALGEVSRAVSSTLDLETVLSTIVARAVQLSGTLGGVIYEYDDDSSEFHVRATHQMAQEQYEVLRATPVRLGQGAVGQAGALRKPVEVPDILDAQAPVAPQVQPILVRLGYRALLAVPLLFEDRITGGLVVWRSETGHFSREVVSLLETFATQSVLAIQNARLFHEIEDKSRQLEVASQHKSEFLANMSHELRTPLNGILGFNEMILDHIYGEVPPELREPLTEIQNSGRHLLRLINNVLDLSKIEAGRMELALGDYAVQDTVAQVRASLHSLAADKGLEFVTAVPGDLPLAHGDAGRITQCLTNLAGNAIKFTRQGRVEIAVELQGELLVYRVSDTGIGIEPDRIGTLFTEFRQADATIASEFGGSGLGLSITRKFAEMHGGRVWVESEPGKGSTFFLAVPLRLRGGAPA
jgi:signal transduction histidine kinase/putative methionine-R-sulfoxide reductase with GAF domain